MSTTAEEASGRMIYLHLSDNTPTTEETVELADGSKAAVIWKDGLVEGDYPMTPGPSGAIDKPMRVIAEGPSDMATRTISMADIIEAHNDAQPAFKYVTIPTTHKDGVLDNTGFVPRPGIRVVERNSKKVMQVALGFTEPDVKGKVQRGTIPDVSVGVFFNWLNKHYKKRYRCAMKHVALTPNPFMGNLDPFKPVFASDHDEWNEGIPADTPVEIYTFADEVPAAASPANSGDDDANKGEIVWNERDGLNWVREEISQALSPDPPPEDGRPFVPQPYYFVRDVSDTTKKALVEESYKGDRKTFVIPFERKGEVIEIAPETRWTQSREAMIAATDENFTEMSTETIREKLNTRLGEMAGEGHNFSLGDIALDNRVQVNAGDNSWVAGFAVFSDGTVHLDLPARWKMTEHQAPEPEPASSITTEEESKRPTPSMAASDDPLVSRVEAARQRRRQLVA